MTRHNIFCLKKTALFLVPLLAVHAAYSASLTVNDAYVSAHGNTITGTYTGTESQPAILIQTSRPVVVKNAVLSGPGNLISGSNVDLTVINTKGVGTIPKTAGATRGGFVSVSNVKKLVVRNCHIEKVKLGVYVVKYSGNKTGTTIEIRNNEFLNIDGRVADGSGGQSSRGTGRAHAIQLNGVIGVPNIDISWNQIIDRPYESQVADTINLYDSSGTKSSHIKIHDNYLYGAWPGLPGQENNYAGGGIITDGNGAINDPAKKTAFSDIYNNQVVASSNYGIRIAAGHDNVMYNNRVVSSGRLPDGKLVSVQGKGEALQNYNAYGDPSTVFFNNLIRDNKPVAFVRRNKITGLPQRTDFYLPGQSATGNNVRFWPTSADRPNLADEAYELSLWKKKLKDNGVQIGVQKDG